MILRRFAVLASRGERERLLMRPMSTTPQFAFPSNSRLRLERFSRIQSTTRSRTRYSWRSVLPCWCEWYRKSPTFLAAINLGLTGVVPDPERSFKSINEYARDCVAFTKAFFDGRISQLAPGCGGH